jgi:hypothetical protein
VATISAVSGGASATQSEGEDGKRKQMAPDDGDGEMPKRCKLASSAGEEQGTGGGGDKPKQEPKPIKAGRVVPYAFVGMLKEKGDPAELWRKAVADAWMETFAEPLQGAVLRVDDSTNRGRIVQMLGRLSSITGITGFDPPALEALLTRADVGRLFINNDFLSLKLTTASGKYLSNKSGLPSILVKALGLDDIKQITNKDNVLKWYHALKQYKEEDTLSDDNEPQVEPQQV